METLVQVLIDGMLSGMVYALVAAGLCLIWGVMDVINFAHGEYLMVGMYVSYWLGFLARVDPVVSVFAAGIFVFLLGALTYKLIIRYTIGRPGLVALLATFGLAMFLKNLCMNRFSPNFLILSDTWLGGKTFLLGSLIVPVPQLAAGVLSLVVVGLIYALINTTRFGWAVQATAMDREAAELMGINTERIYVLIFGIGGACVGIAGGIMPSYLAVHPEVGSMFGLIAFVCVAMGGFGSIPGAFLAGLLVGVVEALAGFYIAPVFKYIAVFGLYLAVVFLRPKGIFGW
ncbi:MAG TPA: branched-chain amino acid ABC transporter permease [Syntrophales bacterium]|jgi:branched-chain amino acid transport system permease protein|nr:branched-chain amino acid ABC transporter permease [Syntrophales bacterium]HQG34322.1 branched-chain amino acid ABC transporter permease [Syntrophales bacterium]HQI34885.1 branched-chain amino acid ABC transporter permease [Syntrophales bacterium]HQJ30107.1 branched-chain amino acid ABC transporter permease [Syntrophales bacterium]HRU87719.1 branched-chain amino acid ABC transporter permease [Syntrophales bacterium]